MGGFPATLAPEEVSRYAEAIVTGEAEGVWARVVDDLRHRTLRRRYHGEQRPLAEIRLSRRLFQGKRYLPIGLIETGRGCPFPCEFCAIQTFFSRSYRARPPGDVIAEPRFASRSRTAPALRPTASPSWRSSRPPSVCSSSSTTTSPVI